MGDEKGHEDLTTALRLSESEWRDLTRYIHDAAGIKLSEAKRVFLVSRLMKRLRATGARSFREYLRLVQGRGAQSGEHQELVNAVTTNKTDFFRERSHFDVLGEWLRSSSPVVQQARRDGLRVWCAAASTGEEPYTIAAVLREHLSRAEFSRAELVASDIDTQVLARARRGVYDKQVVEVVDAVWRSKMFVRGTGAYAERYRVRQELREKVRFVQVNLIAPKWNMGGSFDIIFCRNVLIYFDRATQQQVVSRLLGQLEPHGLLFLGHSESLNSLAVEARAVAHSVYAPRNARSWHPRRASLTPRGCSSPPSKPPGSWEGERARELTVGESRIESDEWLSATLGAHSILLVLYWHHRQVAAVCHLDSSRRGAAQSVAAALKFANEAVAPGEVEGQRIRAKVVGVDEMCVDAVGDELRRLGVAVSVSKVAHCLAQIWVEPHTERVLLRKPGEGGIAAKTQGRRHGSARPRLE